MQRMPDEEAELPSGELHTILRTSRVNMLQGGIVFGHSTSPGFATGRMLCGNFQT